MVLKNIRRLCQEHHTTICALEKSIAVGNGTIGRWDKSTPTLENIKKVADYFGVSVDELIAAPAQPTESR